MSEVQGEVRRHRQRTGTVTPGLSLQSSLLSRSGFPATKSSLVPQRLGSLSPLSLSLRHWRGLGGGLWRAGGGRGSGGAAARQAGGASKRKGAQGRQRKSEEGDGRRASERAWRRPWHAQHACRRRLSQRVRASSSAVPSMSIYIFQPPYPSLATTREQNFLADLLCLLHRRSPRAQAQYRSGDISLQVTVRDHEKGCGSETRRVHQRVALGDRAESVYENRLHPSWRVTGGVQ